MWGYKRRHEATFDLVLTKWELETLQELLEKVPNDPAGARLLARDAFKRQIKHLLNTGRTEPRDKNV